MNNHQIEPQILERANEWTKIPFDPHTREEVACMIKNNPGELKESFYRNLEFGTGGLRGIMGVGTNRMNSYTVAMATQGLANYIKKMFEGEKLRVVIAHDSRNNSPEFARITAEVMSANNIEVYLFDSLRPTPELSFAVRQLNCHSGVVITASHNPKEYNGYKAYWNDGGQLISPHDKNVIAEVEKITNPSLVCFDKKPELIHILGEDFDAIYLSKIALLSLSPEIINKHADLHIVYTPIHGTGYKLVPQILQKIGFKKVFTVEQQMVVDGNFPTVVSPNPEETAALELAIKKAYEVDAELVMATDPDADRVGIAVRNEQDEFILLNGNQTASILIYYLLRRRNELKKRTKNEYIVKTIVTTELLKAIATRYDVECYDVLTGFKFIADIILKNEEKKIFIAGGEESYGYLVGDFVRDKDAIISCAMIAEVAAWAKEQRKTLYQILMDIYREFGVYKERLLSLTKKGFSGVETIKTMMENFRNNPPKEISGSKLIEIRDYKEQKETNLISGKQTKIDLPKSDVLQFFTEDGSKISIRPSGTEPKIKFYFGVKAAPSDKKVNDILNELDQKIDAIIESLRIA